MNIPFKFAAASTNAILDLTDPINNLILAGILAATLTDAQRARFAMPLGPTTPSWLVQITVSSDKDATLIFGCYDKVATAFYGVMPVELLAAGSNVFDSRFVNPGFPLPLGGAVVPAIQVVLATSAIICGQIELLPNDAERDATPFNLAGSPVGLSLLLTKPN